jgi:UDP-glucuronate decarboxylase
MNRKKVLITGGAGFIGSHLTGYLLKRGYSVIIVDNFHTGSKNNVRDFLRDDNFEICRHDVTEHYLLEANFIYNLACPASPIHYQRNPVKTVLTSVLGTINALNLAKDIKARILQTSTSEIYGNPEQHPQTESYWGNVNTIGPRSCYDEGKRISETLMFDYHREHGVDIRVARIFNTYGPKMSPGDGRVISNFVLQALRNEPITIFGDGTQTRSFCFVDDMVEGIVKLMNQEDTTGPINLGNIDERSIKDVAELIIEMTNSSSKLVYKPLPKDDPVRRKPDISLAKKVLDWEPKVNFKDGLQKTIEYFRPLSEIHSSVKDVPR